MSPGNCERWFKRIKLYLELVMILEILYLGALPSAEYMIITILITFSLYLPFILFDSTNNCYNEPQSIII